MKGYLTIICVLGVVTSAALGQVGTDRPQPSAMRARVPATLQLLNKPVPEVSFDAVPLQQVLDWLEEFTGATVDVQWEILRDAGVNPDDLISVKVKNMRVRDVLWLILKDAAGPDLRLAYRARGNQITISTEEDLSKAMVIRIYDIRALLIGVARFEAPEMDPAQAMQTGGQGSGNQLFQSRGSSTRQQQVTEGEGPELQKLLEVIRSIEPDTWEEKGGEGTIIAFNGMLIVRNTPLVHQQIGGYIVEEETGR